MTPEAKANQVVMAFYSNPGMAGDPDLQTRIARAIREAMADAYEDAARIAETCKVLGDEACEIRARKEGLK